MPYWRLSTYYFCYFATVGILVPYWGLYLQSLGFNALEIGQLMALLLATKIVAPNLWSWVADYTGQSMRLVRIAGLLSLVIYLAVFVFRDFWGMAAIMIGFSFFWNASLPQIEATTLNHLGARVYRYGRIRLWGSFGFIALVVLLGPLVDRYGPSMVLPALTAMLAGVWLATLTIPEAARPDRIQDGGRLQQVFRQPAVLALLAACLLMQASHAPLYTFFSIYLDSYGYSKSLIGALWAFGVVCEVGVFLVVHRVFRVSSLATVLWITFAVTAFRWLLVAFYPEQVGVMVFAQALHAITFGAYHATAIQLIHHFFRSGLQFRGQALYSSVSFGIGGSLGSLYSGYLWNAWGAAETYLVASVLAVLAGALVAVFVSPALAKTLRAS